MCIGDFIFVTLTYLHACQQHKSQKPYVNLTQKIGLQCVHFLILKTSKKCVQVSCIQLISFEGFSIIQLMQVEH